MNITIFDIETNGIKDFGKLSDLHTIHCLVTRTDTEEGEEDVKVWTGEDIPAGLEFLKEQDIIVGHNALRFDVRAIKRLHPDWEPKNVHDTLVLARLAWPNQKEKDYRNRDHPRNLIGSHSLKAWGYRLGEHKGEYSGDWESLSDDMIEYCIQDTAVTMKLYKAACDKLGDCEAVLLEHRFQEIIDKQERTGFGFDTKAASSLYAELSGKRDELKEDLSKKYPPQVEKMKSAAYWEAGGNRYRTKKEAQEAGHKQIEKGPNRTKLVPFNPDSRLQISKFLIERHGWKPTVFTPSGQPQVDETTLRSLKIPEADQLVTYLTISKRIGQLAEGKEAWLKLERNGRLHGRVNSNGTVTGRCTHSNPNLAQTPASSAPWGTECRSLFIPSPGKVLVGVDASGLELRCLAHYMARWDDGEYGRIIVDGDIHTANQEAAGLRTRDDAKAFIYALIYGAGPQKIGSMVGGGMREGKRLMDRFLARLPALMSLREAVERAVKDRGHLKGLDGRPLPIRSKHSALNSLLQSAGSILMKQATVLTHYKLKFWDSDKTFSFGKDYAKQVAHIHDEIQFECEIAVASTVGELAVDAIKQAGEHFDLRCPLDGEYNVGNNWSETH